MALPVARLLLPSLPACQPPHCVLKRSAPPHHGRISFISATTAYSGSRAAFAACAASASVAPAPAPPAPEAEEPVGPRTRLIVQNIPWDCTVDDMHALFEEHGSVVDVEITVRFPCLIRLKKKKSTANGEEQ